MSRNIGKRLYECSHGAFFRGVIVAETDKTFTVDGENGYKPRRVFKDSSHVIVGADRGNEAVDAYNDALNSFRDEIVIAEARVRDLKRARKDAAIAALKGDAP